MSSVEKEYYEYLMSQDKSVLAIEIMNLDMASSNNRIAEFIKENDQLKQQLHDLPKKIIYEIEKNTQLQSFDYGERYCEEEASNDWAIDLEDLKEILDTILKKYGGTKNEESL